MKKLYSWAVIVLIFSGSFISLHTPHPHPSPLPLDARVDSLLTLMNLEEKIGQLVLFTSDIDVTGPTIREGYKEDIQTGAVGALFNAYGAEFTRELQKIAVEETRLGIPLLFGYDVIHGHKTIFPISLGEAASWDLEAIELAARIAAVEASAEGLHWTFAPMVDISRDPRWGRVSEGAGEDSYLGSAIARARVNGYQGEDLKSTHTILATVKHFAAYGASLAGRDYNTVDISERELRQTYLPPYKAALDAGAATVMTSFNELDGIPASGSKYLMTDILRKEWGFEGFVVTDYTSINEMIAHGQGTYYDLTLNINGKRVPQPKGTYTSDRLTEQALEWLNGLGNEEPFMLYLSHKAVHAEFEPAERHQGMYDNLPIVTPPSMYLTANDSSKFYGDSVLSPQTPVNFKDIPEWVRRQRHSWHGVDYMYHGQIPFDKFYKAYLETLMALDESIGQVTQWLKDNGLEENTIVIYMGDNGFSFGEHGLIDKRHAYEESMKVPLLVKYPGTIPAGVTLDQMVMNIDIAPTLLDIAGMDKMPEQIQGKSFLPILQQKNVEWRDRIFYEYYWEMAYPSTPTIFAVRTDDYKFIFNHGLWGINELFHNKEDPYEMNNLIRDPDQKERAKEMRDEIWTWLEETGGEQIPIKRISHPKLDHKYQGTF